jgi:endo-1,4-beta-xylanase
MTYEAKSNLTRRQFGWSALGMGAAARLGLEAAALEGLFDARAKGQAAANASDVTGANSLEAHAAARGHLYGAAVVPELLDVEGIVAGHSSDGYTNLVTAQTGILVGENAMKWPALRPSADQFDFTGADRLMRFANLTGKRVRGHNLCWHEALPRWFQGTVTKDNARQILTDHIRVVAGHFRGQIQSWDVVNEAIEPKDGLANGLRKSPWLELIGPDYIELAFRTAAEADPHAKLTYNDYDIEQDSPRPAEKRAQVLALLRRFKSRGVPIHAVGVQSHLPADGDQPGAGLQSFIREAAKMGLEVYVTEMDVKFHGQNATQAEEDAAVAAVYRNYLNLVLAEPNVPNVLTWGITDAHTWLTHLNHEAPGTAPAIRQRPMPFDDDLNPTPAFFALRAALDGAHSIPAAKAG